MSGYSRIKELAAQIQARSAELDETLSSLGIQSPSFEVSTAVQLPPALHSVQNSLLDAADELMLLVRGPLQTLLHISSYSHNSRNSLHAIVRFDIAKCVPLNGTATFSDISSSCGLSIGDTTRILRHAMTYRIFSEPSIGVVAHTASSSLLAKDPTLTACIEHSLDEVVPSACRMVDAMEKWPGSQEPNEAGWNIAHDEVRPMFATLGMDQKRAEKFATVMTLFQSKPGLAASYLVEEESMKWEDVKKLVDIGGSHGTVCSELVTKFPGVQCVVQDLPEVVNSVQSQNYASGQLEFMAHNFFEEQPVKDADVYLLRWILHDWSDLYAAKILNAIVPALGRGSRLVINEMCVPEPGTISLYEQRFFRSQDLVMKQIQNAKERDRGDWESLLKLADERFRIVDIKQPQGSELSIITVVLD